MVNVISGKGSHQKTMRITSSRHHVNRGNGVNLPACVSPNLCPVRIVAQRICLVLEIIQHPSTDADLFSDKAVQENFSPFGMECSRFRSNFYDYAVPVFDDILTLG